MLKTLILNNSIDSHGDTFNSLFQTNQNYKFISGCAPDYLKLNSGHLEQKILDNKYIAKIYKPGLTMFPLRDREYNSWVGVEYKEKTILYNTHYKQYKTFEDYNDLIDIELNKKCSKWTLSSITWLDFEDVSSQIKMHIFNKWHLYDQKRSIVPFISRIIINQMINLSRNIYKNHERPCLSCPENEGGELCALYGTQCNSCPLYAKWEKTKKYAHDIKMALPLDNHINEVHSKIDNSFDLEKASNNLHDAMKKILSKYEWRIYKHLFIDNKTDEDVAKILGFKSSEKGRLDGYRQIINLRNSFLEKAKKITYQGEIDFN